MLAPMVSVITVCRNTERTIHRTLKSVQQQVGVGGSVEHLVIDGASTDRTIEIVRSFTNIRWISEPDKGIADAFNKGLSYARGEYILYLNADDYLADNHVLHDIVDFIKLKNRPAWIVGDVLVSTASTEERNPYPQGRLIPISCWSLLFRNRICHQATLVSRSVLLQVGGFDTSYRVAMDFDLWYRLCQMGHRPVHLKRLISVFSLSGISSQDSSTYIKERNAVAARFRNTPVKKLLGYLYDVWVGLNK